MRLIDADALKKHYAWWEDDRQKLFDSIVDSQPTVDAVPVIRCKDCKHYYEKEWVVGGGSYTTCWYQTIANAQPNDFCSQGKRRKEND